MKSDALCGLENPDRCGGSSSIGTKCYQCPYYDVELDGRLGNEDD